MNVYFEIEKSSASRCHRRLSLFARSGSRRLVALFIDSDSQTR